MPSIKRVLENFDEPLIECYNDTGQYYYVMKGPDGPIAYWPARQRVHRFEVGETPVDETHSDLRDTCKLITDPSVKEKIFMEAGKLSSSSEEKTIKLLDGDITVEISGNGGACYSEYHDSKNPIGESDLVWHSAINMLESMVLAHALEGVNVESEAYQVGLETALEGLSNAAGGINLSEEEEMLESLDKGVKETIQSRKEEVDKLLDRLGVERSGENIVCERCGRLATLMNEEGIYLCEYCRIREGEFERYEHHGEDVAVRSDLKGKHRDYCLCHSCDKFKPGDREANCDIANLLYRVCVLTGITTPVWECPEFEEKSL